MTRKYSLSKRIRLAAETPLLRLGLVVVPRLPRRVILVLARVLGTLGYYLSTRSRRFGLENLDLAFGDEKTPAEKRRILRQALRNFLLVMLDLLWFTRDSAVRMERWFVPEPDFKASMDRPGAKVGVTAHFGNWEMAGRYWSLASGAMMSVAMPVKNPKVDDLIHRLRENTGQQIVARQGALKKLLRHLRDGGIVGLLLDQNTKPADGGIFVTFFGRPVAVSPAAGVLAARTGAEIVIGFALPQPDGSYRGEMPHCIAPEEIAAIPPKDAAREITQRITSFYEETIRARPDYWLWSYRRWRYIPAGMSAEGFPSYARPAGD
ncbi:MAG: lysophospholipid acyltransferase family protein [Lentisphaerae bacterium]|jgi:lauroyl/myristoyl acyltransferase|nr:lysophospholipid acyltransferase family protein [Lentisphaerota bacterium]